MRKKYLLQRHDAHQLPDTGDIGVTEAQQGEQRVCLSNEREGEGEAEERGREGEQEEHDPVSANVFQRDGHASSHGRACKQFPCE